MTTEMIVDGAQRQFEATEETLAAWKPEDAELADQVRYAENAIALFLDRPATMRRVVERVRKSAQLGHVPNLLQLWHEVSSLFLAALHPVAPLRDLLARLRAAGCVVERAEELKLAVRDLEELRQEFRKTFRVVTRQEAEADRRAIARGESQDADEAFAEIAGVDVETWCKRVAKHQSGM